MNSNLNITINLKSFVLGAGIAISALGLYALAATLTTFNAGDVVSASKINDNFANLNADIATANTGVSSLNAKFPVKASDQADEPGFNTVSAASGAALAITGTNTSRVSITLAAPANGFAIVTANFNWLANHTTGTDSTADFGLEKTGGVFTGLASQQRLVINGSVPTGFNQQSVALSEVFAVTQGDNTFHLNTKVLVGSGQSIGQVKMTVLFVPTRYGTGATVN